MNGPQHYREAEHCLMRSGEYEPQIADLYVKQAQVHATLALTAATANQDCRCGLYEEHETTCPAREWWKATS